MFVYIEIHTHTRARARARVCVFLYTGCYKSTGTAEYLTNGAF